MKLAWLTDIHLNFLDDAQVKGFISTVKADKILISGDISTSKKLLKHLDYFELPTYFVLGNHDFYHSSIQDVTDDLAKYLEEHKNLKWLTYEEPIELDADNVLIGHDGWADGRFGDYFKSDIELNDYYFIREFTHGKTHRLHIMHELGDLSAQYIGKRLKKIIGQYNNIWVVTHAPPFKEAGWHKGEIQDDNWAPHFTNKAMGDVLLNYMQAYPEKNMTVLCGHTHGGGACSPLPNIKVYTGEAKYYQPQIQRYFEI